MAYEFARQRARHPDAPAPQRRAKHTPQPGPRQGPQLPPRSNHRARAAYWGAELARSLAALRDGTSTNPQEDALHAYRLARVACGHALKALPSLRPPRGY